MARLGVLTARLTEVSAPLDGGAARAGARSLTSRRGLLLRLEDQAGCWGQGEASPLPGYSPDTIEEARAEIEAAPWGALAELDRSAGCDAFLGDALRLLAVQRPSARFAVETALLDLLGRDRGLPVSTLLGAGRAATGPVALSALLPDGSPELVAEAVRAARARGIHTVKLKVGRSGLPRDLELARAARAELGPAGVLRLDANGAWSAAEAREALAALAPLEPEVVEEPVRRWRELATPSPVPVGADESLQSPEAEDELAERATRGACHAIVLKPMALGGFLRCLRLARTAERHRLGVIVTHLFDGPVGLAAAAELALALPATWACGLAPHVALTAWPAVALPQFRAAEVVPAAIAGLGLADVSALLGAGEDSP